MTPPENQERNETMNKIIITAVAAVAALGTLAQERGRMQANPEAKLHRFSTTVEKERP